MLYELFGLLTLRDHDSHLDEAREYKDEDVWSALRYTQMASAHPQMWVYSNAGDQHSIVPLLILVSRILCC